MTTQHTRGRLNVGVPLPNGEQTIGTELGRMVAVATTEANARRLVACWNACDGLPTDLLEDESIMKIDSSIRQERDELLTALGECRDAMPHTTANVNEAIAYPTSVPAYVRESVAVLVSQRDDLLAALREIADGDYVLAQLISEENPIRLPGRWGAIALAAIAKAEGGTGSPPPATEPAGEPESNVGNSHITQPSMGQSHSSTECHQTVALPPPPAEPAVEPVSDDLRDRLVAISAAIADQDDRAAQAMIREILSSPPPPAEEVLKRAAEAACDAIAFNGGTVQMEAHVRAAIEGLK